ncbi:MAG: twin-arginine translocase subunit TatC, partial [Acidobacteriota bacterium]|nr:twin-arginine translocase subunit TatC [Acidobacteriota bacterium]
ASDHALPGDISVTYEPFTENSPHPYQGDSYNYGGGTAPVSPVSAQPGSYGPVIPVTSSTGSGGGKTPPPTDPPEGDDEEDGMLRMSFLGHLEELRKRILLMLAGCGAAFVVSLLFSNELWIAVSAPAVDALTQLGVKPPNLVQISPMDGFNIIWMKLPILCSIFIASPWILYQVWAFIAPGLYKRERRWAAPFVICSAGLFILGGAFAYFVAFRYGLKFLLGISMDSHVTPMSSMVDYFDLFVNVMLGIGLVFEIPILIFFLTLLRIVTPKFLISHSRYAILAIVIIAAVVTPTPDVFNLMLFATPMCLLFYVGIFASYLLVLNREGKKFPWKYVFYVVLGLLLILSALVYIAISRYGYHFGQHWPFFTR